MAVSFSENLNPRSITIEDREPIKDLRFQAAISLAKLNDAYRRKQEALKLANEAEIDAMKLKDEWKSADDAITLKVQELRLKYHAPEDQWEITDGFQWIAKNNK